MPFVISTADPILRVTLHATLTNEDLTAAGREVAALEGALAVTPHRLSDLRAVERVELTFSGVLMFAQERRRQRFPNAFKSAIIASDLVAYGFARMFMTLNDHPQIRIAIFRDEPDAMAWLQAPGLELPEPESERLKWG